MADNNANNSSSFKNVELYYAAAIKYRPGQSAPGYFKREGLLLYALSGSCTYTINGKECPFKKGEIMWSPPHTMVSAKPDDNDPIYYRNFRFEIKDPLLTERLRCYQP